MIRHLCILLLLLGISQTSAGTGSDGLKFISYNANAGYFYAMITNEGAVYYTTVYATIVLYKNTTINGVATESVPSDTISQELTSLQYGVHGKGLAPGDTGYACIEYTRTDSYTPSLSGEIDSSGSPDKKCTKTPVACSAITGNLGYYRCTFTNNSGIQLYNCTGYLVFYDGSDRTKVTGIYPYPLKPGEQALQPGESVSVMFDYQPLCDQLDSMAVGYGFEQVVAAVKRQNVSSVKLHHSVKNTGRYPFNAAGKIVRVPKSSSVLYKRDQAELRFKR